jgi:hypothetical protein
MPDKATPESVVAEAPAPATRSSSVPAPPVIESPAERVTVPATEPVKISFPLVPGKTSAFVVSVKVDPIQRPTLILV